MFKSNSRLYKTTMENDLAKIIGKRVKAVRTQRGMTQQEVADALGRTFEGISNLERGKTAPNFKTLLAISEVLDLPMREFFDDIETEDADNADKQELIMHTKMLAYQMDKETLDLWLKLGEVMQSQAENSES